MTKALTYVLTTLALLLVPATAACADVPLEKCDVGDGALCGHVDVPLDRAQPGGTKIAIAFAVFRHSDASKPAAGALFITEGGPGYSVLNNNADFYRQLLTPLLEKGHDLVLIDQRGVGRSQAIDCRPLQDEPPAGIVDAVEKCGKQLGATSDLYGSADSAKDIEAVRAALGVDKIDFYGGSYAGTDIEAYAARFPSHLRSVVLDSAVNLSAEDLWFSIEATQIVSTVELVCSRSPRCHSGNPNPKRSLERLIRRLRAKPVKGVGRDADGKRHKLTVTEATLAKVLQSDQAGWVVQGEIGAAEKALRHGDKRPLLRLAAETDGPPISGDPADQTLFSVGLNVARFCTDATFAWDKQASPEQRKTQFGEAVSNIDKNLFAPFSVAAWIVPPPQGLQPDPCITWPAPTHSPEPITPAGTVVPDVPALIISGDLDMNVPPAESHALKSMFPKAEVVDLAESGHHTLFRERNPCATELIIRFVDELSAGDTSCAPKYDNAFPGIPAFPLRAHGRKQAARIAALTVTDALRRSFTQDQPDGVGLRGGTYKGKFGDKGEAIRLDHARFAKNLAVTGKVAYKGYMVVDARVKLSGAASGHVRVRGTWAAPGATRFKITGKVNGHKVALSAAAK
jgi:pimeloyl-ACP methyl ester carboxylesterase